MPKDDKMPAPRSMIRWILLAAGLAVAVLYAMEARQGKPPAEGDAASRQETPVLPSGALSPALATGAMRQLKIHARPQPLPELAALDAEGRPRALQEWRGKVLLVNFWATWCPPCRKEMPHIAALQKAFADADFLVLAISEDTRGHDWARQGLKMLGADNLMLLWDRGGAALRAVKERALPVTLLVDRQGREVARLIGPADWNSDEAHAIIRALLAQK